QRNIDVKSKALNRAVEDYQADREDEDRKLMDDFTAKIQPVIGKYVQDNNIAVVLDANSQGLVWAGNSVDITQAIIDAYDKAHPSWGAPPAPAGAKPRAGGRATKQPVPPPPAKPPADK